MSLPARHRGLPDTRVLDAVRGAAALVVFDQHMLEGLLPGAAAAVAGTPFAGCINGPAAVVLFFVLSGCVLSVRPLAGPRAPRRILPLVAKRWPRLAGTVLVAGLVYVVVARLGGFPPLAWSAGVVGRMPPFLFWGQALHAGQAQGVIGEALFGAFFAGHASYNAVLWTMRPELVGSMLAFALAAIALWRGSIALSLAIAAMTMVVSEWNPWLIPFPLGVACAAFHLRQGDQIRMSGLGALLLAVMAALLWSWDIRGSAGWWAWANGLDAGLRLRVWVVAQSLAALGWLAIALYQPGLRRALGGWAGHAAGRLSFAFYLVHLAVMLSLGARLALWLSPFPLGPGAGALLYAVTLAATLLVAAPLAMFDGVWVRLVGRAAARLQSSTKARSVEPVSSPKRVMSA